MNTRFASRALAAACLLSSCAQAAPASKTTPSTDIKKLSQIINLPRQPYKATWQLQQIGDGEMGPSDLRLEAAMLFSQGDVQSLTPAAKRAQLRADEIEVRPWFPAELRRKGRTNPKGKYTLLVRELDASAFHKLSLRNGKAWRVLGTSYCVVSLFTT